MKSPPITRAVCEYFFHRDTFIAGLIIRHIEKSIFTTLSEVLGIWPISTTKF